MEGTEIKRIIGKNENRKFEEPEYDAVGLFLERFGGVLDAENAIPEAKKGKIIPAGMSPEQKAQSMQAILKSIMARRKLKKLTEGNLKEDEKEKLRLGLGILGEMYKDSAAREKYVEYRRKSFQEMKSVNGNLGKYKILRRETKLAGDSLDQQMRQVFSQRGGGISEVDLLLFEAAKEELKSKIEEMRKMAEENPELAARMQYENHRDYANQFQKERFIWVPSRIEMLDEIGEAAFSGKPILLSGESGTGKTRLVEQAALKLTGQINNETAGKDTRFQDLIAKPKISSGGVSFYEYKEIGEAATGKSSTLDNSPHTGRIVADDEFNLLPEAEQTERLARIAAWTPGKLVRMPVANQEERIAQNFLYCAMVNLASERYSRKKIPPEVLRKFAKVDVDYPKQTEAEPEIYEMMVSALMDNSGMIRANKKELSPEYDYEDKIETIKRDGQDVKQTVRMRELVKEKDGIAAGGFLWRLSNALNELNKSFSRKETVLNSLGEGQYLKDMVIDIGTVLGWMKEYATIGRRSDLEYFFCKRIQKQFLKREAYTAEDRRLTKDFLAHFGIDVDEKANETESERSDQENETMTALEIGLLSPRVKYKKIMQEDPSIKESYVIVGGKRVEYEIKKFEKDGLELVPGEIYAYKTADGKEIPHKFLGVTENGDVISIPYKQEPIGPKSPEGNAVKEAKAKWQNPESGVEQEIIIDFEKTLSEQKIFYETKLGLKIDEAKVREIWKNNYSEIRAEMEKYGYDAILIIPDNLPEEEILNQKIIETMEENVGGTKAKVEATWQGPNFEEGGSFAGVRNSYSPGCRIVLIHSIENIEDHPILKKTRNKTVMDVTGLKKKEVDRKIADGEDLPVNCEIEINGKKIRIQAEGQSLEENMVQQVMYFEKTGQHLDNKSNSYARFLKSYSGSRVVAAYWHSDDRQLDVYAYDPSNASDYLGLRLSRSFSE